MRLILVVLLAVAPACASSPAAPSVSPSQPPQARAAAAGGANCLDSSARVADPGAPHGIFVLLGDAKSKNSQAAARYLLTNPDVCGADFWVRWNQVDRGPSSDVQYDWTPVEAELAPWEKAGKEVNLILIGAAEGASTNQGATPQYVLSQVQLVTCGGLSQPTPVFWQPAYEQGWHAFIAETVRHFASDPYIGYLRFGIGIGGEGLVGPGADKPGPCKQMWDAAGYLSQFPGYNQRLIAFEASLRSPHQLMIGLNQFEGLPDLGVADAAQAAAVGIGFGQQGLQSRQASDYRSGKACVPADWCSQFVKYAGKVPLEVQQLALSNPSGAPASPGVTGTGAGSQESFATGPLPPLLTFALSVHAQIFEVYTEDLLLAFEPDYPGHDRYGASYAAAFGSLAEVVGTAGGLPAVGS